MQGGQPTPAVSTRKSTKLATVNTVESLRQRLDKHGYVSQAARAINAAKNASQLRDSFVLARTANLAQRQTALQKSAGSSKSKSGLKSELKQAISEADETTETCSEAEDAQKEEVKTPVADKATKKEEATMSAVDTSPVKTASETSDENKRSAAERLAQSSSVEEAKTAGGRGSPTKEKAKEDDAGDAKVKTTKAKTTKPAPAQDTETKPVVARAKSPMKHRRQPSTVISKPESETQSTVVKLELPEIVKSELPADPKTNGIETTPATAEAKPASKHRKQPSISKPEAERQTTSTKLELKNDQDKAISADN